MTATLSADPNNKDLDHKGSLLSGSKKIDTALFLITFIAIFSGSYFLRVYYRVIVTDIEIIYTSPDGKKKNLSVPKQFEKNRLAKFSNEIFFEDLKTRINRYMVRSGLYLFYLYKTPGAEIEWIIRYSENSIKLDKKKIIKFNESTKP